MRFRAFMKNSIFILNHNAEAFNGKHSYYLKMNQFGDMVKIPTAFNLSLKS